MTLGWLIIGGCAVAWGWFALTCLVPWLHGDSGAYLKARRELNALDLREAEAGIFEETPEFLAANTAVADAMYGVPFWVRWRIDRQVLAEQDYWARLNAALAAHGRDPS